MKARLASLLLVAICLVTPAFAQGAGAPPPDAPSPAAIDAAMDLLVANNSAANMQAMLETMVPLQAAQIRREHPAASDEAIKTLISIVNGAITSHMPELTRIYAVAYARRFSVEELHALAAFYRSDVGQKFVREIPILMKDVTPVGIAYMQGVIRQEVEKAVEQLRKQGEKI